MLYDLASDPPEPGSLLESVLLLVAKRRQESQWLGTRALLFATIAQHLEKSDMLQKAMDDYTETMFPFINKQTKSRDAVAKKALDQWTSHRALRVRPMGMSGEQGKMRSRLIKQAQKIRVQEAKWKNRKTRQLS